MRLSVIKHDDNETVFYNPGVFLKDEDLIIFPFKEFDKFYNETVQNLNVVTNIIKDSLNSKSAIKTTEELEYVEDWMNLIKEDMNLLIKFNVQTTLNSFNGRSHKKVKPPKKINETSSVHKEEIQCLMGLWEGI